MRRIPMSPLEGLHFADSQSESEERRANDFDKIDRIAALLREQLERARAQYEAERDDRTIAEFTVALEQFARFVSRGITPAELRPKKARPRQNKAKPQYIFGARSAG
jgi:hypothetical protein